MVINVSVQYNGGFLPEIILLTLCDYIREPFYYHVELLSSQPMFPPKSFDCSGVFLVAFIFLLNSASPFIFVYVFPLRLCPQVVITK